KIRPGRSHGRIGFRKTNYPDPLQIAEFERSDLGISVVGRRVRIFLVHLYSFLNCSVQLPDGSPDLRPMSTLTMARETARESIGPLRRQSRYAISIKRNIRCGVPGKITSSQIKRIDGNFMSP